MKFNLVCMNFKRIRKRSKLIFFLFEEDSETMIVKLKLINGFLFNEKSFFKIMLEFTQ